MSMEFLETQVVNKLNRRIITLLFILYAAAFLDRVNVGFAALSMNQDLGFSSTIYGLGAGIFFIGYFTCGVPGNLIMIRMGARVFITWLLVLWGAIAAATAFISTPTEFYIVRFLLGAIEASFFPGMVYYLSTWYRGKDLAKAVAFFLLAMPACNILASPISAYLMKITWLGWAGWKWMFFLEGIPACILGLITYFYLTDRPEEAKWLTSEEKAWLTTELEKEKAAKVEKKSYTVMQAITDRDVLILSAAYFLWVCGLYGITLFMPLMVQDMSAHISLSQIGYLTSIPYIGGLLGMYFIGKSSDRTGERRNHIIVCMLVGAIGLAGGVYFHGSSLVISMVMITIAVTGIYGAFGPFWSIPSSFLTASAAAGAIAFINSVGNLGGFTGPYAMGFIKDATGSFNSGVMFLVGCLAVSGLLLLTLKKAGKVKV